MDIMEKALWAVILEIGKTVKKKRVAICQYR